MAFRVVSGSPPQPGPPTGDSPAGQGGAVAPPPPLPRPTAADQSALVPLVERLEALSFTFEALNASSRTYAAEAVLETLGRMERRDLQALAAIEAFASALKTVSQHLAGLRNAIQTTAHDAAGGFHQIGERLDQLEARLGSGLPAASGGALTSIAARLGHIEEMIGSADSFDPAPVAHMLEAMVHKVAEVGDKMGAVGERLAEVGEKVDSMPVRVAEAVDFTPVTDNLETIAERVASVERKIDEAGQIDVSPLREALDTISQRVARIEQRIETAPELAQGFDPAPITEVLEAISARISTMESRVSAGPNVDALTDFLGMVNQRLERMETGLGVGADSIAPVDESPDFMPDGTSQQAIGTGSDAGAESAPDFRAVSAPAPAPSPLPPIPQVSETPPAATKQQVDNLLEQVLKVLSR